MTGIWERCEHCGNQWSWALQPSHGCAAEDRAGLFVGAAAGELECAYSAQDCFDARASTFKMPLQFVYR
jgi:hypothetical protein